MHKVAAIQMCSTDNVDINLATTTTLIAKAAAQDAKLIVLPENFALMGLTDTDKLAHKENFGTGKIQSHLATLAKQYGVWIVAGTIPIASQDCNKVSAACLVYNAQGDVVARYDKMHLFDVTLSATESYKESATIEAGTKTVVVDTPVGKLGLAVCYDVRFPNLFTSLAQQGAELFALPTAFTALTGAAHWHVLTRARAIENFCYFIGACQGGVHANGRKTYGHSLIIEPWGTIEQELAESGAGVIVSEINLEHLYKVRTAIPVQEHRRPIE